MFASDYASSSYLHPITPPAHSFYDGVSIVTPQNDYTGHAADMPPQFDDEPLQGSSCHLYPPPLFTSSYQTSGAGLSSLAPPSLLSMPSPFVPYAAPPPPLEHDYAFGETATRSSLDISTPALMSDERDEEFVSHGKMDMGMAETGTEAAQAGIHTPLATYAAQMAVWLWHGSHAPSTPYHDLASPQARSAALLNSPNPFELSHPTSPINPLQVAPTAEFQTFVSNLLKVTMVSHSVTLVALLYIYRLKTNNRCIVGQLGSERKPFVVSLILGNKYLDDNTYTNATWAELAGIPLKELNRMESEFLKGLGFRLGVEKSEYTHWRNLLDGFIFSRQQASHHASLGRHRPSWSPQTVLYTPTTMAIPQLPEPMQGRARSASPLPVFATPNYHPSASYNHGNEISPVHRKRTAVDAFATDVPTSTQYYEHMRLPVRKAQFGSMDAGAGFNIPTETPTSGLARSSSLTRQQRQIARLPGEGGRRGSMGHIYGATTTAEAPEVDLRHAAAMQWQNEEHGYASAQTYAPTATWPGSSALITTYDASAQPAAVPPEHLMFYTLAAEAHPGYDGAPRKAILRYQHPAAPQTALPASQATYPAYSLDDPITYAESTYPLPGTYGYAVPQPAQFANAGPPGYAYDASASMSSSRRSTTGLGISGVSAHGTNGIQWSEGYTMGDGQAVQPASTWRARSQWSSPAIGRVDPKVWQQV